MAQISVGRRKFLEDGMPEQAPFCLLHVLVDLCLSFFQLSRDNPGSRLRDGTHSDLTKVGWDCL